MLETVKAKVRQALLLGEFLMSKHLVVSNPKEMFNPSKHLILPDEVGDKTVHAVKTRLLGEHEGRPVYLLTESGRTIFCSWLASLDPWVCWPEDLLEAVKPYTNIALPNSLKSWQFHMINLLWRYSSFAFRRSDLLHISKALHTSFQNHPHPEWFPKLNEDSDVIQHVNKSGQFGLVSNSAKLRSPEGISTSYYWLRTPVRYDPRARFPKPNDYSHQPVLPKCDCKVKTTQEEKENLELLKEKERAVHRVKDWHSKTFIEPPISEWTLEGHKDPFNKDLGTVAQPSAYNRQSKSKWKFDDYSMPKCPTVEHLKTRLDEFYSAREEKAELARVLLEDLAKEDGVSLEDIVANLGNT